MYLPALFAIAVALCVLIGFVATWRLLGQRDPVDERLRQFGVGPSELTAIDDAPGSYQRRQLASTNRRLAASGLGMWLANTLTQADSSLTAAEFTLIVVASFIGGLLLAGAVLHLGLILGLLIGVLVGYIPIMLLNRRKRNRQRAFTEQLPEVLTLLVGALRAGHGISQAMGVIVSQLSPPTSVEFGRTIRSISLGLPLQDALADMATRIGTDEIWMIVTAISVQHESGGNLAQTLETVGETVRERLRVKREIRTLTAQQRLTGYILAVFPVVLAAILYLINPPYIKLLLAPGLMRIALIAVVVMEILGFFIISRIVDIEV
jgi:tight adherence protein B